MSVHMLMLLEPDISRHLWRAIGLLYGRVSSRRTHAAPARPEQIAYEKLQIAKPMTRMQIDGSGIRNDIVTWRLIIPSISWWPTIDWLAWLV